MTRSKSLLIYITSQNNHLMLTQHDSRRIALCVVFISLLVLSGCVTVSVNSTVGSDGTIELYEVELTMAQKTYDGLQQMAHEKGYSSIEAYLTADLNKSRVANIEYAKSDTGRNKTITLRLVGYTPPENGAISTTKRNGTVIYVDRTFTGPEDASSGIPVQYTLTMPGKILNSTADNVEGNTATWDLNSSESSQTRIYARSEISTGYGPTTLLGIGGLAALATGAVLFYRFK